MVSARVLTLAVLASSTPAAAQDRVIAFTNVNVIAMDREEIQTRKTVVVSGRRIVAVNDAAPPNGATVVDGTGRFLLPGLIDSHVHLTTDMPWAPARADFGDAPLYLAHGVTTVINLRGTSTQLEWKRRIEAGELLGPTIYNSGDFVNEPRVTTPDEVARLVESQARDGYDLIKFHEVWEPGIGFTTSGGLSQESYLTLFEAARAAGLPVVGHAPVMLGIDGLIASSGGALAHVGELVRLHFRPPLWVLLIYVSALLLLAPIVAGWGISAILNRWRGAPRQSARLRSAKILAGCLLVASVAVFFVGPLAGIGGLFFDRAAWRLAYILLSFIVIVAAVCTAIAVVRTTRDTPIARRARLPLVVAAIAGFILAYTSAAHFIPSMWKIGDGGRARAAARLRDAGISVQTTLGVYETGLGSADAAVRVLSDRSFQFLAPQTQALWRRLADRRPPGVIAALFEVPPRYPEFTRAIAGSLHRNGVRLLAGTDAMGAPLVIPGSSLIRELTLLQLSGLTPYEAIRTATINPAQFLEKESEIGAIAVGKRADLILLARNPLKELSAFNEPLGVMVRGQWLSREHLDAVLGALR